MSRKDPSELMRSKGELEVAINELINDFNEANGVVVSSMTMVATPCQLSYNNRPINYFYQITTSIRIEDED